MSRRPSILFGTSSGLEFNIKFQLYMELISRITDSFIHLWKLNRISIDSLRAVPVVFVSLHFNVTEKMTLMTYQTTLNFKLISSFCTNNVKRPHWHKLQARYFSLGLHFKLTELTKRSSWIHNRKQTKNWDIQFLFIHHFNNATN